MGELKVEQLKGGKKKARYIRQLLNDIQALEEMYEESMFEKSPIRIGAEQEFCLVDADWNPSDKAMEVLKALNDPYFTNELALYNLETNLDPLVLTGDCFSTMHRQLDDLLTKARAAADELDLKVLLTGILPTIDSRHLKLSYMTPVNRYAILDQTIRDLRGTDLELHIKGVDEINLHHDSILFEGCNTSFQSHLQIDIEDFADSYNWAQAIAGPVLSCCTNSPLLMGRELWQETRIALFTQSVDTRASTFYLNEREARVGFGSAWAQGSAVDYFKDHIISFRSLLTAEFEKDSLNELKNGNIPKLKALGLHNGTVYKWNRVCYGVTEGKPHIRIENRYMPSGPTTQDEIANLMFWVGVMRGKPKRFEAIHTKMDFKDAKSNFYNAARYGAAAQFYWDGGLVPSKELLLDYLLPLAYRGLYDMNVDPKDVEHYLTIIENRIKNRDGAQWMVASYRKLKKHNKTPEALKILNAAMYEREQKGYAVDAWELVRGDEQPMKSATETVRQHMNTKIISAQENDSAELVLKMMLWKNIHHVPVIDIHYNLVGLLTWTDIETYLNEAKAMNKSIKSIMRTHLITISADTSLEEARDLMEAHQINCLPVVSGTKLRGIITSKDI
ncbi:CBS domain-containing protein [Maribacter halichondriae]|uniref:CBS domain-containing protein n=1 Tax=Maribacter halichondriae TaxID=2980554 RepID=UPI00235959D4|nr:CBS domain-containing protein [Maribacter sp. Hal144]